MKKYYFLAIIVATFGFTACQKKTEDNSSKPEETKTEASNTPSESASTVVNNEKPPFAISDSSKIVKTKSGMRYYIVQEGQGNVPTVGQNVMTNYHGMLLDGTVFDSSFDRGQPFPFKVGQGQVIKGWDEAFTTFKVGTRAVIILPPDIAYGAQAQGKIPANSTLVFHVELLGANN